jgi:hypothetical protein
MVLLAVDSALNNFKRHERKNLWMRIKKKFPAKGVAVISVIIHP